MKEYKLRYLPLFEQDLLSIIDYISNSLHNPQAASKFVDTLENAILERLKNPLAFEPYPTHKARNINITEYMLIIIPPIMWSLVILWKCVDCFIRRENMVHW